MNPPGPAFRFTAPPILRMGRDRLGYLTELARTYGDVAYVRIGVERLYLVSHPELIREVLVTHSRNFEKGRGLDRVKRLLGEGLLTSEGEHHLRQRRMIQPVFHHQRIAGWARTMSERAVQHTAAWRDGEERDIVAEMTRLTLAIVGDTLFGVDVGSEAAEISRALTSLMESFYMMMLPFPGLIERLPLPKVRRMRAARDHLDGVIFRLIDERRKSGAQGDDLLSMLLAAQDTEGDGTGMSNEQVRDEALTIFLAGHETTANALSWTWWLLGQHPDVERRLHEELERVLAGRAPGAADYGALTYTEQIVTESMRLYPPAWTVARRAIAAQALGGYTLPPRAMVLMSQWVMHRDPRYFADPLTFDPARWTAEFKAALPKYAYFPFGGGPRLCIGEGFAWMELVLVVAAIAQQWRIETVPGQSIVPEPVVTLRPRTGIRVRVRAR